MAAPNPLKFGVTAHSRTENHPRQAGLLHLISGCRSALKIITNVL